MQHRCVPLSRPCSFPCRAPRGNAQHKMQGPAVSLGPHPFPSGLCLCAFSSCSVVRGSFCLLLTVSRPHSASPMDRDKGTDHLSCRRRSWSVPQGQPGTGPDAAAPSPLTVTLHCLWKQSIKMETQPQYTVRHPPTAVALHLPPSAAPVVCEPSFRRAWKAPLVRPTWPPR